MGGVASSPRLGKFTHGHCNCVFNIADLGKTKIQCEKNTYGQKQGGEPERATEVAVYENQEIINCVQRDTSFFLF